MSQNDLRNTITQKDNQIQTAEDNLRNSIKEYELKLQNNITENNKKFERTTNDH